VKVLSMQRRILMALLLFIFLTSCSYIALYSNPDWNGVKSLVRETYPNVKSISTSELQVLLTGNGHSNVVLLDVRAKAEFDDSQLLDAVHVASVERAVDYLDQQKKPLKIVVYCSVGYRSARFASELSLRGYPDVVNYEGSIFEWANSGLPVYRGKQLTTSVHPYDPKWGALLNRELWSRKP
jgi:rhodanese-related sulfurtransferase